MKVCVEIGVQCGVRVDKPFAAAVVKRHETTAPENFAEGRTELAVGIRLSELRAAIDALDGPKSDLLDSVTVVIGFKP